MASARPLRYDSSGIKRKEETEELLVFGYSCKLFRDDEKALFIDQGKHLIPWMGDDTLKIDRYDVRGTVYDLRPLEPLGGGASDALWATLSDAERKVEQLCDEERYRALYHNEAEEALYQEEELKRLHQALDPQNSYGQVAYSYDNETEQDASGPPPNDKESVETADEEDEPFIPPQELDIPVGMVLPDRTKLNAIIEKTAAFISTQGPQMEIILKMKQANNPQFSFLSFDCPLHAYYRHVLMAIKTGRYKTKQQRQQQEQNDLENSEHYLHPSLATATKPVELAPSIPSITYKPSADCAYSMLVNKIKDRQGKLTDDNSAPGSPIDGLSREDNPPGTDQSIIAPPSDIQVIIDKMASYVIKNGRDFESVVRSKGDDRFSFLDSGHKYHPYYEHKVRVYQGLESPINFTQTASDSNNVKTQKSNQSTLVKKQSPEKKPRPILLPGYEYSDDSSESDDDESEDTKGDSRGKPKLAPVSFSIKKPKEAEILKEVKSALPVEEESSDGDADGDDDTSSKPPNPTPDVKPVDSEPQHADGPAPSTPEEEMKRLQQLLKEKEKQLREQEKIRRTREKQSEDIFQIEASETLSTFVPTTTHLPIPAPTLLPIPAPTQLPIPAPTPTHLPITAPIPLPTPPLIPPQLPIPAPIQLPIPSPIQPPIPPKSLPMSKPNEALSQAPIPSCLPPLPAVSPPSIKDAALKRTESAHDEHAMQKDLDGDKARDASDTSSVLQKSVVNSTVILLNNDEFLNEISEADVIDLTEDSPKVSDTTRLERKRKAAAFLSRLQKKPSSKNGTSRPVSDADAVSRHSTPSPTRSKRERAETAVPSFHEASIPRTSLMARLAASTHIPRQPVPDKKRKTEKEKSRSNRKSESPVKSAKDKEDKSYHRQKSKRRKDSPSTSESEGERPRSRSRSESYSRSPSKRRQGDDSDSEQRSHRHHKDGKSSYRKKHDAAESGELSRDHSRTHRRHDDRVSGAQGTHGYSHGHSQPRGRVRSQGQSPRGRGRGRSPGHNHSKRTEFVVSDGDSSE